MKSPRIEQQLACAMLKYETALKYNEKVMDMLSQYSVYLLMKTVKYFDSEGRPGFDSRVGKSGDSAEFSLSTTASFYVGVKP